MNRIAILGPGLLGGSIALKLRASGGSHVALWARREAAAEEILALGCADVASTDLGTVLDGADLVVLCVPVGAMPSLARAVAPFLRAGALVTDVGSVKSAVVAELGSIFPRFVGSHPMAGSEHTGMKAASAALFEKTTCIVTPTAATDAAALTEVSTFWQSLGCRVIALPAEEHDECVALISHLPHLVAANLVNTVAAKNAHAFEVVGPGFRDSTRVSSGPPAMWVEILRENADAVGSALDALIAKLTEFRQTLARSDADGISAALTAAKQTRDQLTFPQ